MNDNANALRSKNAKERAMQKTMQKRTQDRHSSAPKRKRGAKEASIVSCRSEKRQAPETHRKTQEALREANQGRQGTTWRSHSAIEANQGNPRRAKGNARRRAGTPAGTRARRSAGAHRGAQRRRSAQERVQARTGERGGV